MRLLLIEDDAQLAGAIARGLEKAGFATDTVGSVEDGGAAVETTRFDTIILDLGLPDGDGLDILKSMRDRGDATPILVLTARDGLQDRVTGLNAGADDYLLKPFEMEELVARIKALLRRPGGALGMTLTAGNVSFDTIAREVVIDGETANFTHRELGVLELLMRRIGHVVPKSVIEEAIYSFDKEVSSNSVEVAIHRVRKKLDKCGADVAVHTVRGVGYLLKENGGK